jgi:hypothetical protein
MESNSRGGDYGISYQDSQNHEHLESIANIPVLQVQKGYGSKSLQILKISMNNKPKSVMLTTTITLTKKFVNHAVNYRLNLSFDCQREKMRHHIQMLIKYLNNDNIDKML